MNAKAYFKNIHLEIFHQIEIAQFDIKICVAWFTDYEIYEKLIDKLKEGLNIEVIIANHEFNKKSKVDFKEFLYRKGKVGYIGDIKDGARDSFMHNKFCIIDNSTLITGSYNWTYKARFNDENILVINNDLALIDQFDTKFNDLKPRFGFTIQNNKVALLPIENIMAKWDKKIGFNQEIFQNKSSGILNKF